MMVLPIRRLAVVNERQLTDALRWPKVEEDAAQAEAVLDIKLGLHDHRSALLQPRHTTATLRQRERERERERERDPQPGHARVGGRIDARDRNWPSALGLLGNCCAARELLRRTVHTQAHSPCTRTTPGLASARARHLTAKPSQLEGPGSVRAQSVQLPLLACAVRVRVCPGSGAVHDGGCSLKRRSSTVAERSRSTTFKLQPPSSVRAPTSRHEQQRSLQPQP